MNAYGCANLWREVLFMTINDALNGAKHEGMNCENKVALTYQARKYLTIPNRDFDLICAYAGIDPDAARDRLTKLFSNAPSPEELFAEPAAKKKSHDTWWRGQKNSLSQT